MTLPGRCDPAERQRETERLSTAGSSQDVSRHKPGSRGEQFGLPSDVTLSSFSEPVNEEPLKTHLYKIHSYCACIEISSLWNLERVVRMLRCKSSSLSPRLCVRPSSV